MIVFRRSLRREKIIKAKALITLLEDVKKILANKKIDPEEFSKIYNNFQRNYNKFFKTSLRTFREYKKINSTIKDVKESRDNIIKNIRKFLRDSMYLLSCYGNVEFEEKIIKEGQSTGKYLTWKINCKKIRERDISFTISNLSNDHVKIILYRKTKDIYSKILKKFTQRIEYAKKIKPETESYFPADILSLNPPSRAKVLTAMYLSDFIREAKSLEILQEIILFQGDTITIDLNRENDISELQSNINRKIEINIKRDYQEIKESIQKFIKLFHESQEINRKIADIEDIMDLLELYSNVATIFTEIMNLALTEKPSESLISLLKELKIEGKLEYIEAKYKFKAEDDKKFGMLLKRSYTLLNDIINQLSQHIKAQYGS